MYKIVIADDHILIREGFKKMIEQEFDLKVTAEAGLASELFDVLKTNQCDVLVLDIGLPDKSGLDILKDLRCIYPEMKILILSMHPEERFAIRSLKSGASGYVSKVSAATEMITAIRRVISGKKYLSDTMTENLTESIGESDERPPHEILSEREFQVFLQIARGKTISEISDNLSLGISTISTYRTRILEKMNMKTNVELIYYATRYNLNE